MGLVLRALRRRRGWRQSDVARAARVSQSAVSRVERGHIAELTAVRRVAATLDARLDLDIRWRGGEIDRLTDDVHARLGTFVAAEMARLGWRVVPEATFMRLGERGSIDLLGADNERRAAGVIELKSELTSYEETQRRLDAKTRVAASVVEERFGWRPRHLGVILVFAETRTNRDRVSRVAPLLRASLPAGSAAARRWLQAPEGNLGAVWFVRDIQPRSSNRSSGGSHRVRRPRGSRK